MKSFSQLSASARYRPGCMSCLWEVGPWDPGASAAVRDAGRRGCRRVGSHVGVVGQVRASYGLEGPWSVDRSNRPLCFGDIRVLTAQKMIQTRLVELEGGFK